MKLFPILVLVAGFLGGTVVGSTSAEEPSDIRQARDDMVRVQIENRGIKDPRVLAAMREVPRHLFIPQDLRSKAYTDRPLHADEKLVRFTKDLNFDWVYRFDMRPVWSNRYYVFDAPYHSLAVERLSEAYREGRETAYFDAYFMDVAPQTDNRPFPSRFLKWHRLKEVYRATGSRMYTLLLSGEMVVVVIFIEAGLLSLALLSLPFVALRKTGSRPGAAEMVYFLSLGIGFMFVELYFIKQLALLYGDPVVSLTVVLAGMLVFSGTGGFLSQRLSGSALVVSLALLVTLLALAGPVTVWLTLANLPYPVPVNVVLGLV